MRSLKSLFLLLGVFVAGIAVAEEPLSPGDELAAPVEEDPLQEGIRRFQAQEIEAAETLLLAARKTRPEDAEASYYLGRVFLAQGRAKEAVESFEQAMALDPKASAYPFWLAEAIVVRIEEVSFFSKLGLARRMRAAYEKAVELDPENLEARISVARYHSEAPAIAGGSAEQAETQLAEIRRRDPALAHVAEGLIHEQLKRPEEAALAFEAAVEVDPESIVGWRELGYYYQRTDRWDDAQRA
ncbi:MAG: tetratricopeptide repeat protein, partial [Acidobacteriota bacterium]